MIRKVSFLVVGVSSLMLVSQASAQVIIPQVPRVEVPNAQGIQLQLEKLLDPAFMQAQAGGRFTPGAMTWGGVQLKKVTPELQVKLGLPENEGLLVAAVGAKSVGEKAGLKANDVLLKINNKAVPNEPNAFITLVRDHKPADPLDLVVVRDGKEETIKGVKMPAAVAAPKGGALVRPGFGGLVVPRININPRIPNNPFQQGTIKNLHVEMNINGATVIRKQKNDEFSGEYSKEDLKITVTGKLENGLARPSEITVTEGKETKKYTTVNEVPAQHRQMLQQIMPSPLTGLMLFPTLPALPEFAPGILPGFEE